MKLIKASYEIITHINGEEILKQIELASRTCYKSEDKIEYEDWILTNENGDKQAINNYKAKSARNLIPKLISRGHEAMLEFGGNITVKFICDRGVSHELVRHRLCSFAQESTRYCNYGKDDHISFIIPSWCKEIKEQESNICPYIDDTTETIWLHTMYKCEEGYLNMINQGWLPQQARSILPNSLKTEINMSANIREWRHILKLRTSNAAHPDMRELMRPLLDEFKARIPILFDDITY